MKSIKKNSFSSNETKSNLSVTNYNMIQSKKYYLCPKLF